MDKAQALRDSIQREQKQAAAWQLVTEHLAEIIEFDTPEEQAAFEQAFTHADNQRAHHQGWADRWTRELAAIEEGS